MGNKTINENKKETKKVKDKIKKPNFFLTMGAKINDIFSGLK